MNESLDYIEGSLRSLAVPIEQVTPDPRNARRHPARNLEIIKTSLAGFGQQKPIVIDRDGICLAGNGTLAAARALGWTHIAAVRSTLNGANASAFGITDNRATDTSEWEPRVLAEHLAALQNDERIDHLLTGFNDSDIERTVDEAMGIAPELPAVHIDESCQVLVACNDEADQRELYERLTKDGFQCRVLTL
jgi:ParB-like chromosome segregation protein Spo0J